LPKLQSNVKFIVFETQCGSPCKQRR